LAGNELEIAVALVKMGSDRIAPRDVLVDVGQYRQLRSGVVSRHPASGRTLRLTDPVPSIHDVVDLETDGPGRAGEAGETPWQ
jgi:hypothetical protein